MRVALAQVDSILGDTEENLRKAKEVVAEARNRGADLTVFPELNLSGYPIGELDDEIPIEAHSEPISSLAEAAGEVAVVVGDLRRESTTTLDRICAPSTPSSAAWPC
jgi:NAD+ synthase (glutamine-hydrolysing)